MMQFFVINSYACMNREVSQKWFCANLFKQCYQVQTKNAIRAVLFFFIDFLLTTGKTGFKYSTVTQSKGVKNLQSQFEL